MSAEWILSSCAMISLVVLIRHIFRRKMQPHVRYALWLVVVLRLLIPVSFSETAVSILNLLPEWAETETGQEESQAEGSLDQAVTAGSEIDSEIMDNPSDGENIKAELPVFKESSLANKGKLDTGRILRLVWLLGVVFWGLVLLVVNLDYARHLRRSRKRIDGASLPEHQKVPVYTTELIDTPCLVGFFHPAIYVTEDVAKDEQAFAFVLCHENVHYRHLDHWWVLVRNLCLCLHWHNPLVWLAARLSRQDGELACDEKVLQILGGGIRVDYGRILLELSTAKFSGMGGWRLSATMGGSKRQLSERLQMIINTPGKAMGIKLLVLILMVLVLAVAFTGRDRKSFAAEEQQEESKRQEESDVQTEAADFSQTLVHEEETYLPVGNDQNLVIDLNFDGWDDLCLPVQHKGGEDVPYSCMIWDQEKHRYEKSVILYNVETDEENEWIISRVKEAEGRYSTIYCRYDENNQLHMIRYVEEDLSPDAVFEKLDLTYVEDDSIYLLPAIIDETELYRTLLVMAKQSLTELYQWTGEKVGTACFQVTDMGSVYFGVTPEDIEHSRTFLDRSFGVDTMYNLSNYEKSISSIRVVSGRSVWYSPILWRVFPPELDEMEDGEIIVWYFESSPFVKGSKVKSVEKRYEDMWTIQTEEGAWYEVVYDVQLREVNSIYGPYPEYPIH